MLLSTKAELASPLAVRPGTGVTLQPEHMGVSCCCPPRGTCIGPRDLALRIRVVVAF